MDRECQSMTDIRVKAARATLTDRMAALERRVVGKVDVAADSLQNAAAAVESTVVNAKDNVQRALGTTADTVRSALDVPAHVRSCPWAGVGTAAVAGFLTGFIPNRSRRMEAMTNNSPGLLGDLWSVLRRELVALGETAIVAATEAAKQSVVTLREPTHPSHNGSHLVSDNC